MSTALAIDIDRALDSALADVGEAQQLRRRLPTDPALRRGLRALADEAVTPAEVDSGVAARRAAALFILGRDAEVGAFATKAESHRVLFLWGLSELYRDRPLAARDALQASVEREPRDQQARLKLAVVQALTGSRRCTRGARRHGERNGQDAGAVRTRHDRGGRR